VNEERRDDEVILVDHKLYKKTRREINKKHLTIKLKHYIAHDHKIIGRNS